MTNLQVYLLHSEQIDISEKFRDDQKVPKCQVCSTASLTVYQKGNKNHLNHWVFL